MGFPSPWDRMAKFGPGGPDQSIATIVILPDEVPWRASRGESRLVIRGWVKTLVPSEPQNSWDLWM
jgi:hypothetical protein